MNLETVRAIIAKALLGDGHRVPEILGRVTLREHQRSAAERLMTLMEAGGGALLAEPVGLGKTYTSIAVAKRLGGEILIVAPASLRTMWAAALEDCGEEAEFISYEALSRGALRPTRTAVVIIDEAHRVRSPGTRRYAALAEMCRRARVLLVSATPIHNRRDDLAAQLALFLGRRAWMMDDEELASYVVRDRTNGEAQVGMPRQSGPHLLGLSLEDDCLDEILALPPPVAAKDESIAATLLTYGLLHQWTSSRGALVAALRRRRTRGMAMLAALDAGRCPTRAELAAWTHSDDAVQLAFPELVVGSSDVGQDISELTVAIDRHTAAIQALLVRCGGRADPDTARADALRRVRAAHSGERIIAFCHYAETVNALWRQLSSDAGVGALTAQGGRVAGGRLSRDAILTQFTPSSRVIPRAERIELLITTDVLSEGLNLQEASVVVHLDLPWNPARLDQRVGRVRRMGSRHETVTVYCVSPPASASRLLRMEARLRDKLCIAQRTVGVAGQILPSLIPVAERGAAEDSSVVHRTLQSWRSKNLTHRPDDGPAVVAVEAPSIGYLAAIYDGQTARLIADFGDGIQDESEVLSRAVQLCDAREVELDCQRLESSLEKVHRYLRLSRAKAAIDFTMAAATRSRRAALARVAQVVARTPRHRRAQLAPLVDAARAVATSSFGEGGERVLESLVQSQLPDEAWLRSIATFGELNARPPHRQARGQTPPTIVAIILFQPSAL